MKRFHDTNIHSLRKEAHHMNSTVRAQAPSVTLHRGTEQDYLKRRLNLRFQGINPGPADYAGVRRLGGWTEEPTPSVPKAQEGTR